MKSPFACLLAGAAAGALAQVLPQVTVTATRNEASPFNVPASVNVIDGERLRAAARPEVNLSEGLGLVPGIVARDRQNYAQDLQLSIRGFGARSSCGVRGVRLYVDGIPATMRDGQGQLSHIDLASAGRIEVLRRPYSSGGVLQVFTEPGAGRPTVTPSLAVGSDGLVRPGVRASGAAGALRYSLCGNRFATDGWREHSAARRKLANARLDLDAGEGRDWTLVANSVDLRADDPLGLSRSQFEERSARRRRGGAELQHAQDGAAGPARRHPRAPPRRRPAPAPDGVCRAARRRAVPVDPPPAACVSTRVTVTSRGPTSTTAAVCNIVPRCRWPV